MHGVFFLLLLLFSSCFSFLFVLFCLLASYCLFGFSSFFVVYFCLFVCFVVFVVVVVVVFPLPFPVFSLSREEKHLTSSFFSLSCCNCRVADSVFAVRREN